MKSTCVSIADTEATARVLDLYMRTVMGDTVDSYFMTYGRTLLSGALVRQTDLFIVELFSMDCFGPRAEGIAMAEKWLSLGKRALVVSGAAYADSLHNPLYWDLAAKDLLNDRITTTLAAPVAEVPSLAPLRECFGPYCRPAEDPHRRPGAR